MSKGGVKKVTWQDARAMDADAEMVRAFENSTDGSEFLVINVTYGTVRELPEVIIVTTEESSDGTEEVSVIPEGWVLGIE